MAFQMIKGSKFVTLMDGFEDLKQEVMSSNKTPRGPVYLCTRPRKYPRYELEFDCVLRSVHTDTLSGAVIRTPFEH